MPSYIVAWGAVGLVAVDADNPEDARVIAQEKVVVDLATADIRANVTTSQFALENTA